MANRNEITGYSIATVINYRYVCSVSPVEAGNRLNYPILSAALNENEETSASPNISNGNVATLRYNRICIVSRQDVIQKI